MQPEIIEQRKIVDQIIKLCDQASRLNNLIKDEEFKTDFLVLIGQHRRTFEEQNVTDHSNCLSYQLSNGSFDGITGSLMFWADENGPQAIESILETAKYLLRKHF